MFIEVLSEFLGMYGGRSLGHPLTVEAMGGAAGVAPRLRDGPAITNGEDALPPTEVRLQLVRGTALA